MKSQGDKFNLTLQGLARTGRHWDDAIPLADLLDESFDSIDVKSPFFGDMLWKGSLEPRDAHFELAGKWQMKVPRQCGRCNVAFAHTLKSDVALLYALGKSEDDVESDLEVLSPPGELNMIDVLREQLWLAWQPMVVCSSGCKGLCQQCGVDLNTDSCKCDGVREDHPLAALKNFKFDA